VSHRGRISKDTSDGRWAAACDCSAVWHFSRWHDAINVVTHHVRQARKGQALGVGFSLPKGHTS